MNENCLEGFRCPKCRSEEPFIISIRGSLEFHDNGWNGGDLANVEWDDNSFCECSKCDHSGIVADFNKGQTKGKIEQSVCPECGNEETSRLEMVFGNAGVLQDGKGGWDYDGTGTEVSWDSQTFTGIWVCDKCCHEWGEFDMEALRNALGKWAPEKPKPHRDLGMEILAHAAGTGLHHPIEAITGWHGALRITGESVDDKTLCGILHLIHSLANGKEPKSADTMTKTRT